MPPDVKEDQITPTHSVNWTRVAAILLCVGFALMALWLLGKYVISIVLPFVLGWLVAYLIRPLAEWLSRHSRLPRKLCTALVMAVTVVGLGWLLAQAGNRAISELGRLLQNLTADGSAISTAIQQAAAKLDNWTEHIPLLNQLGEIPELAGIREQVSEVVLRMLREAAVQLSSFVSSAALSLITGMPTILLSLLAFVLSCYYFCADGERMEQGVLSFVPSRWRKKWPPLKEKGGHLMRRYLRAYALLMLLTFAEMFVGFSVLGVSYAFLLAAIVAVVDLLPMFGTGTILIPWAVGALLLRQYPLGSGLLILYGISLIVRQIAEPRLVGASLGLHPLASFAAMFAGFRLFGIWGLLMGPAVALLVGRILKLFHRPVAATE